MMKTAFVCLFAAIPLAAQTKPAVSFVKDVMPVLNKTGCTSGPCHGSAKGKNGFKLSLRGYDPEADYRAIVHDLSGRRFNRTEPEQSLVLLKPSMGVPHGGKSFRVMSIDVHTIRDGKIVRSYHVEDWMGATRQLAAK